jgi:Zn finger protein HypA/HybF involved in hydrogenase expression
MTDALDGNAAAGALADIFISEMTVARATCAKCGDTRPIGELCAYLRAPGIVLRCPTCHTAEVRIVRAEASAWLDLRGIRVLQLDVPATET